MVAERADTKEECIQYKNDAKYGKEVILKLQNEEILTDYLSDRVLGMNFAATPLEPTFLGCA